MSGADTIASVNALYDVAGQIRSAYIELQNEIRMAMGNADAQGR